MSNARPTAPDPLKLLRLLQFADSALPIGATAHSWGLETLVADGSLPVDRISSFLDDYIIEAGLIDAVGCRTAHRLATNNDWQRAWLDLNAQLAALRPARESRAASATLGRRLLRHVAALGDAPLGAEAIAIAQRHNIDPHASAAFGLCCGTLGLDEDAVVLAYLHQTIAALVSACQRLMPLGQTEASRIVWRAKPALIAVAEASRKHDLDSAACWTPLLDLASMRHPRLETRLFIS